MPAIVVASAAPAYADSGRTVLGVADGSTQLGVDGVGYGFVGLGFNGFTIQSNQALAVGDLRVTLTLTESSPPAAALDYEADGWVHDVPSPWVTTDPPYVRRPSLTFAYPLAVAADTPVVLSGMWAIVVDTDFNPIGNVGIHVTVTATDADPVVRTFG